MKTQTIKQIQVQGYRAYGREPQTLAFNSPLAVVWGQNSQGKTSLAEAFEFLFTGKTVRREFTASSADEFADALRNAHLSSTDGVFVEATIIAPDGGEYTLRRELVTDYTKKQDCSSRLFINGAPADESELPAIGIVLSPPPLQAPVLAQHTLAYLFSARPQDRANYFKTLLEVTDLEDFRNEAAAIEGDIGPTQDGVLGKLAACSAIAEISATLAKLSVRALPFKKVTAILSEAAQLLINSAGEPAVAGLAARVEILKSILADRRAKAFPIQLLRTRAVSEWRVVADERWAVFEDYVQEKELVLEETRRLISLFRECLNIKEISDLSGSLDCPVCGTANALTETRIAYLKRQVSQTESFQAAERKAADGINHLAMLVDGAGENARSALPGFLLSNRAGRRANGFSIRRILTFLGNDGQRLIVPWMGAIRSLLRARRQLRQVVNTAEQLISPIKKDISCLARLEDLRTAIDAVAGASAVFNIAHAVYMQAAAAVTDRFHAALDADAKISGWQEFVELSADDGVAIRKALIGEHAKNAVRKELQKAIRSIDKAKEKVLDDKFGNLSGSVLSWWDLLRPEEPTFFSTLAPRPGARRTIDLKAGLSASSDRSAPKLRDVIAVFSQSQLHCLGLALFLARIEHEGSTFVVLDDPVLSSDEDYRVHFNTGVIACLLDKSIQTIILTQDQKTRKDLETRYRHLNMSMFHVTMENPAHGSCIHSTSDELSAMISRAEVLTRGGHPDLYKQAGKILRDAGERFCKEILVKARIAAGDSKVVLTDFDGKTLEELCPKVDPLLNLDPSHPGKLQAFRDAVNPPSHDNEFPSKSAMQVATGDLKRFVKDYLGR